MTTYSYTYSELMNQCFEWLKDYVNKLANAKSNKEKQKDKDNALGLINTMENSFPLFDDDTIRNIMMIQ